MQNLLLDFVSVTEGAALAALPWVGRGKKLEADDAATTAMRKKLNQMAMNAVVVIGEGEMDQAPMLYIGERVGLDCGLELDIAVDPLEGTNLTANGRRNAIAVIAAAPKGSLLHAPDMYMEKISVGPQAAGKIDIDAPLIDNLQILAEAKKMNVSDLKIAVQDRERHREMIEIMREAGAKVQLFDDGDVLYSIAPSLKDSSIDMFLGIGGAPEGVISAVAIKCLGGDMQGRLLLGDEEEYKRCLQMGLSNPRGALTLNQLVSSDDCIFSATGITDSFLLNGIRNKGSYQKITHTMLAYGAKKRLQFVETIHEN